MTNTDTLMTQDRAATIRRALLAPRSIALIGASDDPGKTGGRPLQYLRKAGYSGVIYPVNPRSKTVQGEQAWPDLAALPEVPEHAFILTGTELACEALEKCARMGVKAATILAGGFAEEGPEGDKRQQRLRDISLEAGLLLLGPNSLGLVNASERLVLTANAAFAESDMPPGRTFVASQSGSMLGALVSRGKARSIGFAGMVSVGGEAVLSVGEICAATVDDPGIDSYLLFLESIRHSDDLRDFARKASQAGKPVIVYKVGRSKMGAALAQSHTGAMAGEDAVADAFLRDCGFARVDTFESIFESLSLARQVARHDFASEKAGICVVTTTGGAAAMVVDQLGLRGIDIVRPLPATFMRLAEKGVKVNEGHILDLTLAGTKYEVMRAAIETLLAAPECGAVIAVVGSSSRFQPHLAVRPIVDAHLERGANLKPILSFLAPEAPEALRLLADAGVPCFRTPEACADSVSALWSRRPFRELTRHPVHGTTQHMLDELSAYTLIREIGIACAPALAIDLAKDPLGRVLAHPSAALAMSQRGVTYPVVIKALSDQLAHKSDVGGVLLGIRDDTALADAVRTISGNLAKNCPELAIDKLLVQHMQQGLGEVLLGYRIDAEGGPLIMLAAGGVMAEVYQDRSIRLAPVGLEQAHEMIGEVKAMKALTGFRGRPPGDLDALARAIVALSSIACRADLSIVEAEINPLIVREAGAGVVAVDAVVWVARTRSSEARSQSAEQ